MKKPLNPNLRFALCYFGTVVYLCLALFITSAIRGHSTIPDVWMDRCENVLMILPGVIALFLDVGKTRQGSGPLDLQEVGRD